MALPTNELTREMIAQIGTGILFIVGLWREWWVMGGTHRDVKAERDRWRDLYLSVTLPKTTQGDD